MLRSEEGVGVHLFVVVVVLGGVGIFIGFGFKFDPADPSDGSINTAAKVIRFVSLMIKGGFLKSFRNICSSSIASYSSTKLSSDTFRHFFSMTSISSAVLCDPADDEEETRGVLLKIFNGSSFLFPAISPPKIQYNVN